MRQTCCMFYSGTALMIRFDWKPLLGLISVIVPEGMKAHLDAWVGINDDYYHHKISINCIDPPLGLFYQGQLMAHTMMCWGIVGSRKASVMAPYRIESMMGLISNYCIVLAGPLVLMPWCMTKHFLRQLPTIAILASGLDGMMPTNQSTVV